MSTELLPKSNPKIPRPLQKPIVTFGKKHGYSKISAILLLTAFIIASALTFLLTQKTAV
jgi:hypothetical protein